MSSTAGSTSWSPPTILFLPLRCRIRRSNTLALSRMVSRSPIVGLLVSATLFSQAQAPQPGAAPGRGGGRGGAQADVWAGKKHVLIVADPQEWYGVQNYHHQAASHAMAVMERIGR